MSQSKNRFRYDAIQDRESIQAILEAIQKGIAKGKITFSNGEEEITLEPAGLLNLKVSASAEDDRRRLGIRISWQVEQKPQKKKKQLKIK